MPSRLLALHLLILFFILPSIVLAQSKEAKEAYDSLVPRFSEDGFTALAFTKAAALDSLDDSIWLMGSLADSTGSRTLRRALLVEKASMLELTGRYKEAAQTWESVAKAIPGVSDAKAILSAAACMLLTGDVESASKLVTAVSFSSPDAATESMAQVINAWIFIGRGDRQKALSTAQSIMESAGPDGSLPGLLIARAATEGIERASYQRILSERFSSRPETTPGTLVLLALLLASNEPLVIADLVKKPSITEQKPNLLEASLSVYQVGAFKDETNARLLAGKLGKLGLNVFTRFKENTDLHVVYVRTGVDEDKVVLTLKDAGYEAWRLEDEP